MKNEIYTIRYTLFDPVSKKCKFLTRDYVFRGADRFLVRLSSRRNFFLIEYFV